MISEGISNIHSWVAHANATSTRQAVMQEVASLAKSAGAMSVRVTLSDEVSQSQDASRYNMIKCFNT